MVVAGVKVEESAVNSCVDVPNKATSTTWNYDLNSVLKQQRRARCWYTRPTRSLCSFTIHALL